MNFFHCCLPFGDVGAFRPRDDRAHLHVECIGRKRFTDVFTTRSVKNMSLNREASPGTPGAGYQDTNDRDIVAKQNQSVHESEASRDGSIDLDAVSVLPGTGGPDDTGTEEVPADYDRTGHAAEASPGQAADGKPDQEPNGKPGEESGEPMVDPKTVEPDGTPVENPAG